MAQTAFGRPHVRALVGIADSLGLDLQDGELVDQFSDRNLHLLRGILERYFFWATANLPGLTIQAWDVAISPRGGPVLVKVNSGGDFNLPQLAAGRGLLTGDFAAFVERHGVGQHLRRSTQFAGGPKKTGATVSPPLPVADS